MTKHPPIGLSGFARSGKTAAAQYLEKRYNIARLHIAEPLRDMLYSLLADYGIDHRLHFDYLEGALKEAVIPAIGKSGRDLQISLGTAWGREQVHPDLWAKLWGHRVDYCDATCMNDSVRFPNEEAEIRRRGGFTIMIVREECEPIAFKHRLGEFLFKNFGVMWGVHDSERVDRLSPTVIITNNGTLEQLYEKLDAVMASRGIAPVSVSL